MVEYADSSKTITVQAIVKATFVHGLNDVYRNNSVIADETISWHSKGQIVIVAPRISGKLYLIPNSDADELVISPMYFVSIASADTAFDFEAGINWR